MIAAKAGISFIEKIAPVSVKALGKAGVAEMALLAGGVAEGLNLLITPIVTPMTDKATEFLKNKIQTKAANKQQELLKKRAAILEQKAQKAKEAAEEVTVQEETVEKPVEEKPNTSKKKGK